MLKTQNELFRRMGIKRVGLVTPYTADVQTRIAETWARAGFQCSSERHRGLADNFSFATVAEPDIEAMVRAVAADGCDAVAILCTNLRGTRIAPLLEAELGLPILDSIAVTMWAALQVSGAPAVPYVNWGRLFQA